MSFVLSKDKKKKDLKGEKKERGNYIIINKQKQRSLGDLFP